MPGIDLRLYLAHGADVDRADLDSVVLNVVDDRGWAEFLASVESTFAEQLADEHLSGTEPSGVGDRQFDRLAKTLANSRLGVAWIAPRGEGPTAWNPDDRKQTQIRRRFMLLGQTRDGMQVWDVARAAAAVSLVTGKVNISLAMRGKDRMAGIALYASLFTPGVSRLELERLAVSHHDGPIFPNVLRFLDVPQAVAMAAERAKVVIYQDDKSGWDHPQRVAEKLGWQKGRVEIRRVPQPKPGQPQGL